MAVIFDQILLEGVKKGQMPARTSTAREWYRKKASSIGKINETKLMNDKGNKFETQFRIGQMYMFYYDPKHKMTLPYYDRFPLVFPINKAKGGFLGINMHYLPLKLRAKLMDALYDTVTNKNYDETTKLKISYKILNSAAKYRYFTPTIKHYLASNLRSKFLYVHPAEWDIALFLQTQKFEKANAVEVWDDSKKIIQGWGI
jgi:hypothetical protein